MESAVSFAPLRPADFVNFAGWGGARPAFRGAGRGSLFFHGAGRGGATIPDFSIVFFLTPVNNSFGIYLAIFGCRVLF